MNTDEKTIRESKNESPGKCSGYSKVNGNNFNMKQYLVILLVLITAPLLVLITLLVYERLSGDDLDNNSNFYCEVHDIDSVKPIEDVDIKVTYLDSIKIPLIGARYDYLKNRSKNTDKFGIARFNIPARGWDYKATKKGYKLVKDDNSQEGFSILYFKKSK